MEDKILIINTGGTIGMVGKPLRPAYNWQEITAEYPILEQFPTDYYQFETLIDSSDANPDFWLYLAKVIENHYDYYIGFVILHGTDTMAYTGSILSYMFKNLAKPIILTGAQSPLVFPRSDGLQNLINSIYLAGHKLFDIPLIPEVCICFRDTLLRANRSKKTDSNNYYGFSSPNYLPLAELGSDIKVMKERILSLPETGQKFCVDKSLNSNVVMLELFPGMEPKFLKELFKDESSIKALILKTYGSGNTPTNDEFINTLKYISDKGIPILDVTQCVSGSVKMPLYASTDTLSKMGIISGSDITSEAAITKMMYLLGQNLTVSEIKEYFSKSICGEQSV